MGSFLVSAREVVSLPGARHPSPTEVADWLERTLGSDKVRVERVADTLLEFRSKFRFLDRNDSLAFVAHGEIEVTAGPDGPIIAVRANPHWWYTLIPVVQLFAMVGWSNATTVLRWGAGVGGILIGGVFLFLTWAGLRSFLNVKVSKLRMLLTRPSAEGRLTSGGS